MTGTTWLNNTASGLDDLVGGAPPIQQFKADCGNAKNIALLIGCIALIAAAIFTILPVAAIGVWGLVFLPVSIGLGIIGYDFITVGCNIDRLSQQNNLITGLSFCMSKWCKSGFGRMIFKNTVILGPIVKKHIV